MIWEYILPPIVGALIGLGTNKIAIWMLFHPQKKWIFCKIPIPFTPGVIPKNREKLIDQLAEIIHDRLLSSKEVVDMFKDSGLKEGIVESIDEIVEEKLSFPFIPENLKYNIKLLLSEKILSFLETFLEKHSHQIAEKMNIKEKIQSKMAEFSLDELENLIYQISGTHLQMITLFGGVLGFLLGLLQVGIILIAF